MIYIITNSYPEEKKMFSSYEFEYILNKEEDFKILSFSKIKKNIDKVNFISIKDGIREIINPKKIIKRKVHFMMVREILTEDILQLGKNIYSYLLALAILNKEEINEDADLIFSYWFTRSSTIAYYLNKLTGIRYLCQGHGSDIYVYPPKNIELILKNSIQVLTVGNNNKNYISLKYNIDSEKINVYRLGVSNDFEELIKGSIRSKVDSELTFLTVGRYVNVKGIDMLLEAIYKIIQHKCFKYKVKFIIVGDGPEHEKYKNYIDKHNLNRIVDLRGWANRFELASLYKNTDAYILPSRSEGLPVVLTEACAASLPIIAMDVGSVDEVAIEGENAIIVKNINSDSLSEAILKFINMNDTDREEMRKKSFDIFNEKFRLEKNLDQKYQYIKVLNKSRKEKVLEGLM